MLRERRRFLFEKWASFRMHTNRLTAVMAYAGHLPMKSFTSTPREPYLATWPRLARLGNKEGGGNFLFMKKNQTISFYGYE